MKNIEKLIEWFDQQRLAHGKIVFLPAALALFLTLVVVNKVVGALFAWLMSLSPYLILFIAFFILFFIVYLSNVFNDPNEPM